MLERLAACGCHTESLFSVPLPWASNWPCHPEELAPCAHSAHLKCTAAILLASAATWTAAVCFPNVWARCNVFVAIFCPLSAPQVFKELEPGLNISRLSDADFLNFVRLSTYCTRYVRLKEVR